MGYDTKTLKRDGSGITPVPQHFNPTAADYEPQYGRNGAGRVELYGPDGNPITSTDGKLAVRASEIETLLDAIKGKDYATQTTLATLLTKAGFDAKADITISALRDALRGAGDKTLSDLATALASLATTAKQDTLAGLVATAAKQDIIKGVADSILAKLNAGISLSGSNMEYYGATIEERPSANTVPKGTTFTIVDANLDQNWISDGSNWEEV